MSPCPICDSPAVTAALDQLVTTIARLDLDIGDEYALKRAIVRLVRLTAHGTDNPPNERTSQ